MIVQDIMTTKLVTVAPDDTLSHAANLLRQYQIHHLPVVRQIRLPAGAQKTGYSVQKAQTILVGLLTRSDLLMALARAMGIFEPGMQLLIPLPLGDMTPLAKTLLLTTELHVQVHSVIVVPQDRRPRVATLRLGTINPSPLLIRLREENIEYTFADPLLEGDAQ